MTDSDSGTRLQGLCEKLDRAVEALHRTSPFAKGIKQRPVLDLARRIMQQPGGVAAIYDRIGALEEAGIFHDSDWQNPDRLQPWMAANTIRQGEPDTTVLEALSELRLAAVARGALLHPGLSDEEAGHLLSQILALNLPLIFGQLNEAERVHLGGFAPAVHQLYQFLAGEIGLGEVLDRLINEIWRMLDQRPIEVDHVKEMITSVSVYLADPESGISANSSRGAERLISALYGPTRGCQEDPGFVIYTERLANMDAQALRQEALGFSRSMLDTGLVSPYHAVFLRYVLDQQPDLIGAALGLSSTGNDALHCYQHLVHNLIAEAVWPETAESVYGLSGLLERGILYNGPLAPALWRQIGLPLSEQAIRMLGVPATAEPSPRQHLLAGVLCVLGQPLGVGQGNNPTCQSARALSMWANNDPDYLLQILTWAARDDDVVMRFEGQLLSSRDLTRHTGLAVIQDVDPVSAVTVPHLDAIYQAMGVLCADRGEQDPHQWINPEFHGWWVGRGFAIAVDVPTGNLTNFSDFVKRFYGSYHPLYNGNQLVIHPQPAGIAVTDSAARFIGWHAISIQRVGLDPGGEMRVYFYNPNNDSGQHWGQDIQVSTNGCGERFGESSLPFPEFTSRLYIYHFDPREVVNNPAVPVEELEQVLTLAAESWAADRNAEQAWA
ncbi:hypothetical protein J2T57_002371 [Natronocella acetinitrilica]|uniref:Uncharacterized protein n=1 Tax=Natronocella acetinitrilica TaxID=414046 RepID=A0AAE3G6D4_9GAMM|nr:hypothetical protein [Natronocella acetinitrilica]MCP1675223.1 hypothetical protein [Natronocella acetinitrilica]